MPSTATATRRTIAGAWTPPNWKVAPTPGSSAQSHDYRYQYDGNGNRTSISTDSVVSTLGYNAANEWVTDQAGGKTATYSWDAAGEEVGNDGFGDPSKALAITYNAKHQTATITDTRQHAIPMAYTGPGQAERVSAGWVASNPDTPGGSASYTYGSGLVNQTDSTGTTYYTRDPDGALISQRLASGAVYHYLTDWEGSVVALVDPAGTRQAGYFYCPTGNDAEPPTGPAASGNFWRFLGLFFEPGTKDYLLPDGGRVDSNSGNATEVRFSFVAAASTGDVGGGGTPSLGQQLADILRVLAARAENGFDPFTTPLIVDESAEIQIPHLTTAPQVAGYNAQDVRSIFGRTKVTDAEILSLARKIPGYVVTYDQGRDEGGGFAERAILLNNRRPKAILRVGLTMSARQYPSGV